MQIFYNLRVKYQNFLQLFGKNLIQRNLTRNWFTGPIVKMKKQNVLEKGIEL